ncbi:MAG: DUF4920 domain-containing protein [Bacteroidetes bacterium]|nr:MAG: DUF4920 domain-containing protein [Bacteroidota bacterium]
MNKIIAITLFAALLTSCGGQNTTDETSSTVAGNYGDTEWDASEAISGDNLLKELEGKDSVYTTVSGNVSAACQAKGCWMNMDVSGEEMYVKFKDYGFFVPKNSADHDAVIKGWAYVDTLSVAEQIEIAKDSEASEEEIASITEPKVKLSFTAEGVVMK